MNNGHKFLRNTQSRLGFIVMASALSLVFQCYPLLSGSAGIAHAEGAPGSLSPEKKKELQAEFKANRKLIVSSMRKMMDKGDYIPARAWGDTYKDADIQDKEFQALYAQAKSGEVSKQAAVDSRINTLKSMDTDKEEVAATQFCKNVMRKSLKAPSTAKFPLLGTVTRSSGNLVFMVNSYVDAENSYGARLRTQYHCRLRFNGGGLYGWTVDEFGTGEE